MVPNPSYSGPVKPTISVFKEVPFTSDSAEYNSLVAGDLDFGYLPTQDITAPAKSPLVAGANNPRLSGFSLDPLYLYGINYFPYNFTSTGDDGNAGAIFSQLYVRQAFQYLVDQPLFDNKVFKGYAVPTYGPVPILPPTYADSAESSQPVHLQRRPRPRPCSAATAGRWCPTAPRPAPTRGREPNQCGANIPKGAALNFNLQYATGTTWITQLMTTEKSSWAQVGINITLSSASFDTVLGIAVPCSGSSCTWELQDWGGGWEFSPDYYPTGEEIFSTGAGSNSGSYSNATNDANTKATNDTDVNLDTYQNFLAKDLPVIWQPNPAYEMSEISNKLHGATPQNVFGYLTPENWYLTN